MSLFELIFIIFISDFNIWSWNSLRWHKKLLKIQVWLCPLWFSFFSGI